MKISFYYVDSEYIQYLKDTEVNAHGFTRVPNVDYANRKKFVYGVIMEIGDINYYVPISSERRKSRKVARKQGTDWGLSCTEEKKMLSWCTNKAKKQELSCTREQKKQKWCTKN